MLLQKKRNSLTNTKTFYFVFSLISLFFLLIFFLCSGLGIRFNSVFEVSFILVSAFLGRVGYQIFVPVINTYDKPKVSAKISFYGALVGMVLNFALIPLYGMYGAAYATWGAFFVFSFLAYMETRKIFNDWRGMNRIR